MVKAIKTKKTTKFIMPVYNPDGTIEKEVSLPQKILETKVNPEILAQYIRVYQANQRQGTASTKTRSEVIGSTRKIYRQKGTGRARHGDIKAPIFVGGGVVGGPKPRDYSLKLNKKQKKMAFYSALALKLKNKEVYVLSDKFLKIEPKTKKIIQFFDKSKLEQGKKLIVVPNLEKNNLILATRNLKDISLTEVKSLNPYQILNCQKLFFLEKAVLSLEENKQ